MNTKENPEITKTLKRLEAGMLDYMPHASYTKSDVENCLTIIDDYLDNIDTAESKVDGLKYVEQTVTSLNKLNENLNHELIETDQREDIAHVIIFAGYLKGFNNPKEDITERWREW